MIEKNRIMDSGIFISIKPCFTKKIESGEKNYEFRKYIPKKSINKLYVYESSPTCQIKYILYIDKIVEYPNKIDEQGYGNKDFNNGLKKSKYAYHIAKIEKLNKPLALTVLKKDYGFCAPQSFAYGSKYPKLVDYINKNY